MPRRLLRDGRVVADDWAYLGESESDHGIILTAAQWFADRPRWSAVSGRLGVILSPADKVEQLQSDLGRFELVGADFPGPSEGRGYTQGRLLRERYRWQGELRAVGYVRRDQLFFLARCGFNSFELPDSEFAHAEAMLSTFSAVYQPSNDAGLSFKPHHR